MTQVQLAHTEAQHFALVQNVMEMQNQVAEMEIEVEVWQAMAQQGQQPPIAPPAAPAAPDEIQGDSGLSEGSFGGPPPDIEEVRLQAATNLSAYQDETLRWKNKKIRPKLIRSGDLVLRKVPKGKLKGKMHGKWEGPFIATATANEVAFKLRRLTGEEEPYTWNVDMLQKYFV
jgi:hypothetical protein